MTGAVSLSISDSITSLHGVGPKKAKALEKLKIRTIEDFLSYYPGLSGQAPSQTH